MALRAWTRGPDASVRKPAPGTWDPLQQNGGRACWLAPGFRQRLASFRKRRFKTVIGQRPVFAPRVTRAKQDCYTRRMSVSQFARIPPALSTAVLLLVVVSTATSAQDATGHFEVYCDGFGFFLAKIHGTAAPRKLLLFLYTGFPGVPHVSKNEWKAVFVYRNGCAADGKCEILARGQLQLDNEITRDSRRVSGKYEVDLSGQHLRGQFAAERRLYKHPPRLCM